MATITQYKKKSGKISYRVLIRIAKNGNIVHMESETFDSKSLAKVWATKREAELSAQKVFKPKEKPLKISKVIQDYISQFGHNYGRSKNYDLARLLNYSLAELDISELTAQILIAHCIERNKEAKPQTVKNDVIWLKTAIRTMRSVNGFTFDLAVFDDAYETLWREKLIGKSVERERRPTQIELRELSRYFARRKRSIPMLQIMWFAIYSARRLSEITRLEWADNDTKKTTGLVRDAKHPRLKAGNHKRFKYPRSAWKIVQRQHVKSEFIFPYNPKTIGANFDRACKMLGIVDLHFHDLRHEATSRLFEQEIVDDNGRRKLSIPEVQQVTLHESWKTLQRYVNLNPGDVDI
jgi:integrase